LTPIGVFGAINASEKAGTGARASGNKTRLVALPTSTRRTYHMPGVAVFFGTPIQPGQPQQNDITDNMSSSGTAFPFYNRQSAGMDHMNGPSNQ